MRKTWVVVWGALAIGLFSPMAMAADHRDGTAVLTDPTTDINDVFAWMNANAAKVYLVMTLNKNATTTTKFSNAALYTFHTRSRTAFGVAPSGGANITCSFDNGTPQNISCWVIDKTAGTVDYVTGDASATAGLLSTSGKVKVFAGLRNDPFFFFLDGFKHAASTVNTAAGALTYDAAQCPTVDNVTSTLLVNELKGAVMGPAVDNFTKDNTPNSGNVLTIAIAIDKTLLTTSTETTLSVWGSTNKIAP